MSKSVVVRARMEPELKAKAELILERLGVNPTQAINMLYRQVELRGGLPFDVAIPNKTTEETLRSTDAGRDFVLCKNEEDMFT